MKTTEVTVLHLLSELTLHAHVLLERGLLQPVPVVLAGLVVGRVILGLSHGA